MFWANWLELEKHNDWGVRGKNDAVAALWDKGADGWEKRSQKEEAFAKKQAEALAISKEDTVLDVCCGTGPLTALLAADVYKRQAYARPVPYCNSCTYLFLLFTNLARENHRNY